MTVVIGLTGGIASGKSTVSNLFKDMGVTVIDADVEARLAVNKGEPAYQRIIEEFGEEILLANGEIDRQKLGSIIFHDETKRQILNGIVHPDVRRRMTKQTAKAIHDNEATVVLDIPLLFESNLTYMADKTLLVYVNEDTQLERLIKRNQLSKEDAVARIQSQMSLAKKRQLADAVIDNNGTIEETKAQLLVILAGWGIHEKMV